jgi:hypothetical protein
MNAFLSAGTPESSTRLIALLLALGFIGFAFAHPDQGGTLTIIGGTLLGVLGAKVTNDVFAKHDAPKVSE